MNIFAEAADVIRERGWHQGNFVEKPDEAMPLVPLRDQPQVGGVCLLGALGCAKGNPWITVNHNLADDVDTLIGLIDAQYPEMGPWYSVADWNDKPGRTQDEVIAILEKASQL